MKANNILKAICAMADDDNQGIRMSTTLTGVKDDQRGSIVSFGVEKDAGEAAKLEFRGIQSKYMICCFFIDRDEIKKYQPILSPRRYFITFHFLMSKNKLEQQLMDAFQRYEHTFIDHSSVADIEAVYNFVLEQYKSNKGRSFVPYSQHTMHDGNICIRMGEQIMIDLTKVEGNFSDLRKEDTNV